MVSMRVEGYVYGADHWCEDCLPVDKNHREVDVLCGECDSPCHCNVCRVPLECSLTSYGMEYVLEQLVEELYSGPAEWNRVWCFPPVEDGRYRTSNVIGVVNELVLLNAPDRLPILADALGDADFEDATWLNFLRNGIPGGVPDLERLRSAILGTSIRDKGDWYVFQRQAAITREWAEDMRQGYHLTEEGEQLVERFLELTAPDADVEQLLRGYVEEDVVEGVTNSLIDWSELLGELFP